MSGKYAYLNPDFEEPHTNLENSKKHAASTLAYEVSALITTIQVAADNDCSGIPFDHRGIDLSLKLASKY